MCDRYYVDMKNLQFNSLVWGLLMFTLIMTEIMFNIHGGEHAFCCTTSVSPKVSVERMKSGSYISLYFNSTFNNIRLYCQITPDGVVKIIFMEYLVLTQTTILQIVLQWSFGTRQSPMQFFHLMLVCWMILLSIQVVTTEVLGMWY